ncbi:hypothetical protein N5923_23490 [Erwiniaceae bacterium BAC15a-03b]|uniref:Uncharacterized protein n=1 Tax=Winslowiella arboricola TaxID=2978220 RepID=A0A9J6PZX3_9GAMM|nr:hypothetical protein [Winslowiella arboricola]MCU5775086.1 hypothetical protein [Winslowiella arboricola]MCU5780460.1 hypothetical protein [Winslowiella arboricola]
MIDPSQPLDKKKEALEALIKRAREKVERASVSNGDEKTSLERQQLEGERGQDEKALDDLKSAVESLANAVQQIDTRSKDLENEGQEQFLTMREMYAKKAYRFVWLWSVALIVILVLQGAKYPHLKLWVVEFKASDFNLESNVLIALISGVTVNIVAVFIVVMRNLFPSEMKARTTEKKKDAD